MVPCAISVYATCTCNCITHSLTVDTCNFCGGVAFSTCDTPRYVHVLYVTHVPDVMHVLAVAHLDVYLYSV